MRSLRRSRGVGLLCGLVVVATLSLLAHFTLDGLPPAVAGAEPQAPPASPPPPSTAFVPNPPPLPSPVPQVIPSETLPAPAAVPAPPVSQPVPAGPARDWPPEALIAHLDKIRAQKAELEAQEKELVALLRVKLRDLKENLEKRGITPETGEPPRSVGGLEAPAEAGGGRQLPIGPLTIPKEPKR